MAKAKTFAVTLPLARRVLKTVDAGLVSGLGEPIPGQMCVEAAVNFAFDLPHGDHPPCVGEAVREFKIGINDAKWSSNTARTDGLRRIAVAQLGSNVVSQERFAKALRLAAFKIIMPLALRYYAAVTSEQADSDLLENLADAFASVRNDAEARALLFSSNGPPSGWGVAYWTRAELRSAMAHDVGAAEIAGHVASAIRSLSETEIGEDRDAVLTIGADIATDVLRALGTKGSAYLRPLGLL